MDYYIIKNENGKQYEHAGTVNVKDYYLNRDKGEIDMLNNPQNGDELLKSLHLESNATNMPNKFMVSILRFSHNEGECIDFKGKIKVDDPNFLNLFKISLEQWEIILHRNPDNEEISDDKEYDDDYVDNSLSRCCCSHIIHEIFYMYNKKTHNLLSVGNCCVKKFGNDQMKDEINQLESAYRKCKSCNCYRKADDCVSGICKLCLNSNDTLKRDAKHRCCTICKKFKINVSEPEWKNKCKSCYQSTKNNTHLSISSNDSDTLLPSTKFGHSEQTFNDNFANVSDNLSGRLSEIRLASEKDNRQCVDCGGYKIPKNEPEWKLVCKACYRKNMLTESSQYKSQEVDDVEDKFRPSNNRQCSICKEYKIPLDEPKWKTKCKGCYFKSKH